ncbi:hypothetical protein [Methylobacter sp.]|nr:hypothetical protein [Methylobacter sp.]MDI1276833.1 hypothetical protein [Methylobacter sp.]MDI1357499.1 hypothetical protein [Methylobacter sp.]
MQFDIEFNADHLDRVMEAVRREIATPQEMLAVLASRYCGLTEIDMTEA